MAFPAISAGQRITAGLLTSMMPIHVVKASDTSRASTTTLADDPELVVDLEANARYRVEMWIHYSAVAAGGFKTAWTVPAGATGLRTAWGADVTPTSTSNPTGDGRWGIHAFATACSYGTRDSANQALAWETGDVITTSAGTLALQWAQTASNATATRLVGRSLLRAWRIG